MTVYLHNDPPRRMMNPREDQKRQVSRRKRETRSQEEHGGGVDSETEREAAKTGPWSQDAAGALHGGSFVSGDETLCGQLGA